MDEAGWRFNVDVNDEAYVGKKACPKCGSKDNVHRYPDGHEYCFGGCGYYKAAPLTKEAICALLKNEENKVLDKQEILSFASDATNILLNPGLTWLKKYGILDSEIEEQDILWSASQEQLIFPIFDADKQMIAWQARNFISDLSKYHTVGKMDSILHILGLTKHQKTDIIIVEDIVSAIKVSRYFRSVPLFGSGCSRNKLSRIRRYTDNIRFWLDRDKFGEAMKLSRMAAQMGFKTSVIYTEKDPKEYFNQEILNLGTA